MNKDDFKGLIIGNFKLKKKIGDGAYSMVFLAEEMHLQTGTKNKKRIFSKSKKTYVACKIVPRKKVEEKKITTRLDQEIRIHQMMHHPNIVQLVDIQKDELFYYIFLEFCPFGTLYDYIIQKNRLTEIESAIFFKQLLLGLQYIHSKNVGHRDLKLENILLDHFGTIKISDFGLSKLLSSDSEGLTKTPCGSPCYASPECLSGSPYDCKKSDIWSCGVILYTITSGHLPWTCRTQSKLFSQIKKGNYKIPNFISDTCSDLISKMMTVDNDKRISIEEAINHPFLNKISVNSASLFDYKYLSLRKIDRIFGKDENYEYYGIIDHLSIEIKPFCNSYSQLNYLKINNCIENENEKKKKKEKFDELSSIVRKINRDASQVQCNLDSKEKEEVNNSKIDSKEKKKKRAVRSNRKKIEKNESKAMPFNHPSSSIYSEKNEKLDGALVLAPRRSEKNSLLLNQAWL